MATTTNLVTEELCESLRALQGVRSFDFPCAYEEAMRGVHVLRGPDFSGPARQIIAGRFAALRLWSDQQHALVTLRASMRP